MCMKKMNQTVFEMQKKYFQSGSTRSVEFRVQQLKNLKRMVKEHEEEIMDAVYRDFGKAKFEQFLTEIGLFYDEVNLFVHKLKKWMKPEKHKLPITHFPCKGKMVNDPYGVVLLISPFNYPFGLIFIPLVGAIAGGNCVMIKPSEYTMHFVAVLKRLVSEYFEEGYIYVCDPSGGKDTVNELLEYKFDYIFFTGSTAVGKIVMERAAKNLIPVTLELGGKSPCIVTEHANIKMAAKRIAWGKMLNAGQTCVAPDYVWVQEGVKDIFLQELKNEIERQYGKNPKENKEYCRVINAAAVRRLKEYLKEGTIYSGGDYDVEKHYFGPTILVDVNEHMSVMQDEIFGPVMPVMSYQNIETVLDYMKRNPNPLALYLFTQKKEEAEYLIENIPSGGVMINDVLIHVATSKFPFGGVGQSGMGFYHGYHSFETFTHKRTILDRKTYVEFPMRFAPYSDYKMKIFRFLMK